MVRDLAAHAVNSSPDLLSAAFYDWAALGLSTAFRGIEWAQESKEKVKCAAIQLRKGCPPALQPMAFIPGDFNFLDKHRRPLHGPARSCARYVTITWRTQKNNINGQQVTFGRAKTAFLCPVRAVVRIQDRAELIQHPLGLLGVASDGPITKFDATNHLRARATRVYGYTDKDDLNMYTLHSIRVGACVLLHEMGKTATFIKDCLRWRSENFMDYLRNTPRIAAQHAACL